MKHLLQSLIISIAAIGISSSIVAQPFAYITNAGEDTVSVVDTATNAIVDKIAVGDGPLSAAVNPDGTRVYVANSGETYVSVIDANTNTVVDTVTVGQVPVGVAVHPDGSTLYVTNTRSDSVSIVDTTTNTKLVPDIMVGSRPQGVALLPDGTRVYITNRFGGTVTVIDTVTNTVVDTIVGVGADNRDTEAHPGGGILYVANFESDTVSVIDTETNSLVDTVSVEDGPNGLGVHPDGTFVYVCNLGSNNVSVINTSTNSVVATIPVGARPAGVGVTPAGDAVYVTNLVTDGTVSVIETATNTLTDTIAVGIGPSSQYGLFIGPAKEAPARDISIDIKPGNKRNVINPRAKGGIWVAVLSDINPDSPFDPSSQVDIPTVEFGPDGAKAKRHRVKDINKDGLGDLLLRFKIPETGIACGDTEATLIGETFEGVSFTGIDSIKTVGCKPVACLTPPEGLISWWPGDGNTDDIVGENNGFLEGGAGFGMGIVDGAFLLDGIDDFVNVPNDDSLNFGTNDFSAALWVNFDSTDGEQVLIEKWIQKFPFSIGWTLTKLPDNQIRFAAPLIASGVEVALDVTPPSITIDTWNFVTLTRTGNVFTIYWNGASIGSDSLSVNTNSTSSVKFGHRCNPEDTVGCEDTRGFYLDGLIDEVQIYNRALNDQEIEDIFESGGLGICKSGRHYKKHYNPHHGKQYHKMHHNKDTDDEHRKR